MTVHASADCPLVAMLRPRSGHAQRIISDYGPRPLQVGELQVAVQEAP